MAQIFSLEFVLSVGAQEVLGTFLALVAASLIQNFWKKMKFGGWSVRVIKPDASLGTVREIGQKKAEEILDDVTTLSIYLKGLCSPFGWLVVDLVTQGIDMGILVIDKSKKTFVIDLSVKGAVKEASK